MTGKTHKAVGLCAGITGGFWLMSTYNHVISCPASWNVPSPYDAFLPTVAVSAICAAVGAMLPDIDHNKSRLGAARKKVVGVFMSVYAFMFLYLGKMLFDLKMYKTLGVLLLIVAVPVVIFPLFAKTKIGGRLPKISFKHRGIMHTLALPLLLLLCALQTQNHLIWVMLMATAVGYVSHLLTDCLTKMGCPIFWPVTSKNISLLPVGTGTVWEYVISIPLCAGILLAAVLFLLKL